MDIRPRPGTVAAMRAVLADAVTFIDDGRACAIGVVVVCRNGVVLRKSEAVESEPLARTLIERIVERA